MINPKSSPIMKRFLSLCLIASVFGCFSAQAYDFYVDGIYYNQTGTNTVGVSYKKVYFGVERIYNYKGKVVIPEKITVNDVEYRVTSITKEAFSGCEELTDITIPQSITSIGNEAFSYCRGLKSVTLPSSITRIGDAAFLCCSSLTSIAIPASLDTLSYDLFWGCTSLESMEIPNTVKYVDERVFEGCTSLKSVSIPSSIKFLSDGMFSGCTALTSITIPSSIRYIEARAFNGCTGLTSFNIPSSVEGIGEWAFKGCTGIKSIFVPDGVEKVGWNAFDDSTKIYVNRGSAALLALWYYEYVPYQRNTDTRLYPPVFSVDSVTQTTITATMTNPDNSYDYWYVSKEKNDKAYQTYKMSGNSFTSRGQFPNNNVSVSIYGSPKGSTKFLVQFTGVNARTLSLSPSVIIDTVTATSFRAIGSYIKGDAKVVSEIIEVNDSVYKGNPVKVNGLEPNSKIKVYYAIITDIGIRYAANKTFYTDSVRIKTLQPKVVSEGNVIVQAQTNVDDEEQNVGFEWRRTDWDDTFASSTGNGYVYDGVVEGYIRNMNANRLWKYRAYYQSNSGKQYYGDWVGIDPSNTSYFEPTVHTYARVDVNGNTAKLTGYAQRGTDQIQSQGFIYWKSGVASSKRALPYSENSNGIANVAATEIPADAITVASSGTLMEATLQALDFNTDYTYVAFVKTSEGETFYGAERTFAIGEDPEGVISTAVERTTAKEPLGIYDLSGRRIPQLQKGINIIRYTDGTSEKILR